MSVKQYKYIYHHQADGFNLNEKSLGLVRFLRHILSIESPVCEDGIGFAHTQEQYNLDFSHARKIIKNTQPPYWFINARLFYFLFGMCVYPCFWTYLADLNIKYIISGSYRVVEN